MPSVLFGFTVRIPEHINLNSLRDGKSLIFSHFFICVWFLKVVINPVNELNW